MRSRLAPRLALLTHGVVRAGGIGSKMDERLVRGLVIAFIFGTVVLLVVFKISGVNVTWSDLTRIDLVVVIVALALVTATWVFDSLRMSALVRAIGDTPSFWSRIRVARCFLGQLDAVQRGRRTYADLSAEE